MYKIIGAVIGFLFVRLFVLSEIETAGFRMFIDVLTGGTSFGGGSPLRAINIHTLTSDTSIKLIFGSIAGGFAGRWYEKNKINNKIQDENNEGDLK
jgi:hypothetical protein